MDRNLISLRRKIYTLVAEHARKLDTLQDVYDAVVDSISDDINLEEARARVKASLGSFDVDGKIPEKVQFPFISILDEICYNNKKDCKCQSFCEQEAIYFDNSMKPSINIDNCISCGLCIVACPKGAIVEKTEIAQTIKLIKKHKRVYAILSPAFSGQFGHGISEEQVKTALLMLGFYDVIEVALGADVITVKEANEFISRMEQKDEFMITSCCCPPFVRLAKGYELKISNMVSDSVSPMIATARFIKAEDVKAKVVFIGPCIAKKTEAKLPELKDAVDCVLTFEELASIFKAYDLDLSKIDIKSPIDNASHDGRIYAHIGGVTKAISRSIKSKKPDIPLKTCHGNGIKECREILEKISNGESKANFIEGMACIGGCVGGPGKIAPAKESYKAVDEFAEKSKVKKADLNNAAKTLIKKYGKKIKFESHKM